MSVRAVASGQTRQDASRAVSAAAGQRAGGPFGMAAFGYQSGRGRHITGEMRSEKEANAATVPRPAPTGAFCLLDYVNFARRPAHRGHPGCRRRSGATACGVIV